MDTFFKHPELPFVECRHSTDNDRHYKPHMHKTFCVGAIEDGEAILQVEGHQVRLAPGSLALINPETLHSCNPTGFRKRSHGMLFLEVDWCLHLQRSLWPTETFNPVQTIVLADASIHQRYIRAISALMGGGEPRKNERRLSELMEAIYLQACDPAVPTAALSSHVARMKRQLSANLDIDTSMDRIAFDLQANPFTLLRHFKAATGMTPHAYRLNCRIERAKKLLQKGLDLSQVALACGFFDQSHFHRHFKAVTTVTPRAYQVSFMQ